MLNKLACAGVLMLLLLCTVSTVEGQSSMGRQFAIAFPPMMYDDLGGVCAIIINAAQTTNVQIFTPLGGTENIVVNVSQPYQYDVPCTQRTTGGIENKVYYVNSDQDISAIATNNIDSSDAGQMDTVGLYPYNTDFREFYLLAYVNPNGYFAYCGDVDDTASFYVISAFEDDTTVEIMQPDDPDITTITLDRFQCYTNTTVLNVRLYDFSGFYIRSTDPSKPLYVSDGNACTFYTDDTGDDGGYAWSSIPPVSSLVAGSFITNEIRDDSRDKYLIMVLATQDNTVVQMGGFTVTLDSGEKESAEYMDTWDLVTCDKPCLVFQVNQNDDDTAGVFMFQVSPTTAYNEQVIFSAPPNLNFATDHVIITVASDDFSPIVTQGLDTTPSWECKTLTGPTSACQLHSSRNNGVAQPRIYTTDSNTKFTAIMYAHSTLAEGYGYNVGFNVQNTTVTPPPDSGSPLYHQIEQRGEFSSSDGSDFTDQCTRDYGTEMRSAALSMIPEVNSLIGTTGVCADKTIDDIEMVAVSTPFFTDGSTGVVNLQWTLSVGDAPKISEVESCSTEIAAYLADHSNWGSPLLPDLANCPAVVFPNAFFDTIGYQWACPVLLESEDRAASNDLEYNIVQTGILNTEMNEDITEQCLLDYNQNLIQSTNQQVTQVNQLIGGPGLCEGTSVQLAYRSATINASGSKALSTQEYLLNTLGDLTFDAVYACADEVSQYLQSHGNWDQPIIERPIGCPNVIYDPAEFSEDYQKWVC